LPGGRRILTNFPLATQEAEVDAETRALLTLRLVAGLGPRLTRALIEHFGSAQKVLQANAEAFAQVPRLPKKLADGLLLAFERAPLEQELADITSAGVQVIGWHDANYPEALRPLPDAPPLLYVRGQLMPNEPCIAVVGSRMCTNYGRRIAERLVAGLVQAGYTIVSGLARGIDGIAHQTALDHGGRTIAVFAGGLLCVYPPEHKELAERIVRQGALISEQPMRMPPEREMFPARNRLISGLCQAVVIVEAGEHSGALITARHAAEQGREVFVVPGPVDSPTAGGIVHLLRQGATPVRDAGEILEILRHKPIGDRQGILFVSASSGSSAATSRSTVGVKPNTGAALTGMSNTEPASAPQVGAGPSPNASLLAGLPDYARKLYDALTAEPQDADGLAEKTGLSAQELGRAVVQLELLGLLRRWPGNRLTRLP